MTEAPLSTKERALQMLNRFTFGPRPGDLARVVAIGPDQWFEQQLDPGAIPDSVMDRRLADYTSLNLTPEEALLLFPNRAMVQQVAEGKQPYPSDPQLAAMYEVQVYKYKEEQNAKKAAASTGEVHSVPTEVESAERKQANQVTAAAIAGELFALPKAGRMAALLRRPIPERIAFVSYVSGPQKNLLLADFTPRERALFQGIASGPGVSGQLMNELSQAKLLRDVLSERQVQEVMTDFWFNHFNVYAGKDSDQWYTTSYERDAIRKHALGKFRDLLLATATSPAMMIYLDNWESVGPDSVANGVNPANPKAKRGNKGLNENTAGK